MAMAKSLSLRSRQWRRRSANACIAVCWSGSPRPGARNRFERWLCSSRYWRRCKGGERGVARLEAARARLATEVVQRIIVSLNTPPAKVEDLQTLHNLVVALEKEVGVG